MTTGVLTLLFSVYSIYFQPAPCLSLGWLLQVPAAAAAAAAAPCCGGVTVVCWEAPGTTASGPGLAPHPRNPAEPLVGPELATVVWPGATVAGKEVGVGKPPWSPAA